MTRDEIFEEVKASKKADWRTLFVKYSQWAVADATFALSLLQRKWPSVWQQKLYVDWLLANKVAFGLNSTGVEEPTVTESREAAAVLWDSL